MKKVIATASLVLTLSFSSMMSGEALADNSIIKDSPKNYSAVFTPQYKVLIVDAEGQYEIKDSQKDIKLGEILANNGFDVESHRDSNNKPLDPEMIVPAGDKTKIYRVASEGESTLVDIPFTETTEETDELLKGKTKVISEGSVGKALKTVVVKKAGKNETGKIKEESLIVLESPQPKMVHVGTKEIVVPKPTPKSNVEQNENNSESFVYGQGVGGNSSNPDWAKNDQKTVESTFNNSTNKSLVSSMLKHVGKPYVWGTHGPDTFDCSGLVFSVMNDNGIKIPRLTAEDYGYSATKISKNELVPGDILWTSVHIGIYAGDGKVVHAANSRVGVVITDLSWFDSRGYNYGRLS